VLERLAARVADEDLHNVCCEKLPVAFEQESQALSGSLAPPRGARSVATVLDKVAPDSTVEYSSTGSHRIAGASAMRFVMRRWLAVGG
jgi:hypothetical protein